MATRPIFIPGKSLENLAKEEEVKFTWNSGFSVTQKKKNVAALHAAAADDEWSPILEVSTKSDNPLGKSLSAFNLQIKQNGAAMSIESAYQGSKVFADGGPYTDIYKKKSLEAKKDERIKNPRLKHFDFFGEEWELTPGTAFYDWLYISALNQHPDYLEALTEFVGFTDIEFNPKKSFSCQARTCALAVSLYQLGELKSALKSKWDFIETAYPKNAATKIARTTLSGARDVININFPQQPAAD